MNWLARLKAEKGFTSTLTNPEEPRSVGFVACSQGPDAENVAQGEDGQLVGVVEGAYDRPLLSDATKPAKPSSVGSVACLSAHDLKKSDATPTRLSEVVDANFDEPLRPHATEPTNPGSVGFVAPLLGPPLKNLDEDLECLSPASRVVIVPSSLTEAQKEALERNADRFCWPVTVAMNSAEIKTFLVREARFITLGMSPDEAEKLADGLVQRDRAQEGRRLCLECGHLLGAGPWRCANAAQAEVARIGLTPNLVVTLQHCPGFKDARS